MPPLPLRRANLRAVSAVLTDVDGTLTTAGALRGSTVAALESLARAGLRILLVTGRSAGWGECWARTLPVDGVIAENGGLYFTRRRDGRVHQVYAQPAPRRVASRARLVSAVRAALREVPGARLSMDSAHTQVDLAIDYAEEAKLGQAGADALEAALRRRGVTAVRSSIHVNCWIGRFDKRTTVDRFLTREWRLSRGRDRRVVYVGDSFNDAPLFAAFPLSIGVANVAAVLDRIAAPPAFITRRAEGAGFEEVAAAVLSSRRRRR